MTDAMTDERAGRARRFLRFIEFGVFLFTFVNNYLLILDVLDHKSV